MKRPDLQLLDDWKGASRRKLPSQKKRLPRQRSKQAWPKLTLKISAPTPEAQRILNIPRLSGVSF